MTRTMLWTSAFCLLFSIASGDAHGAEPVDAGSGLVREISLPGAGPGGVSLDYLAADVARGRVWVPAGDTGRVDILEASSGQVRELTGFPTTEIERNGKKRRVGPSSASVGGARVVVGNRGDSSVCIFDAVRLSRLGCVKLDAMPDGVLAVGGSAEVWVTTPRAKSLVILDASAPDHPQVKARLPLDGEPEGYAIDEKRGLFFTNLEDKDRTLVIDTRKRSVIHDWASGCGEGGPKGLALDSDWNLLFLACPDQVKVLDARDGHVISSFATGPGLDNIDYLASRHEIFAAAGRAGQLTVATIDRTGTSKVVAVAPTSVGARNAVAIQDGTAFIADGPHGRVLVVRPK